MLVLRAPHLPPQFPPLTRLQLRANFPAAGGPACEIPAGRCLELLSEGNWIERIETALTTDAIDSAECGRYPARYRTRNGNRPQGDQCLPAALARQTFKFHLLTGPFLSFALINIERAPSTSKIRM